MAGLFVGVFGWLLGRCRRMLVAILGMALYAVLAGLSAGVVRAARIELSTDGERLWLEAEKE